MELAAGTDPLSSAQRLEQAIAEAWGGGQCPRRPVDRNTGEAAGLAFRGKEVSWVVELLHAQPAVHGQGAHLVCASANGQLVSADLRPEDEALVREQEMEEPLVLSGRIAEYGFTSLREPRSAERPGKAFWVRLHAAEVSPASPEQRSDFHAARMVTFQGRAGADVHHFVYVIDRSGSMTAIFDDVRSELVKAIAALGPMQNFHVVFISEGPEPAENPPGRLVRASRENKRKLVKFLQTVVAKGRTDPIPALRRAFAVLRQPNAEPGKRIYLLTDGGFPDPDAVLKTVRALNAAKKVEIYPVLFNSRNEGVVKLMRTIAKENGGRFRRIASDD
jgi:hypothetical protein